ncbi:MAG TPA: tRNA guanosine(34) transglycosylase Tgt [Candidatus Paceibacterota bacterium]
MKRPISFSIEKKDSVSLARAATLHTPHGDIQTPAFIPVGTKATIKGIQPMQFKELGIQSLIANTYHLYLSPGEELIERAGGIHAFMGCNAPIMTDSGGFQVFSLGDGFGKKVSKFIPAVVKPAPGVAVYDEELATSHGKLALVDDEGVSFTSHLDGTLHRFTPERSIEMQHKIGADIIFAFDECASPISDYEYQKEAMERTHRWAVRSLSAHRQNVDKNNAQGLYGIVQGGRFEDLREQSARELGEMDFDGYGIGGSFNKGDILPILEVVQRTLPQEKSRHLLGIGEPEDIFIGVAAGIDTFDCVLPTRNGRTGALYTKRGKIDITLASFAEDRSLIDEDCDCPTCTQFTRSYVRHLYKSGEMLGPILGTIHNIRFLTRLTDCIRESILNDNFQSFRDEFLAEYRSSL